MQLLTEKPDVIFCNIVRIVFVAFYVETCTGIIQKKIYISNVLNRLIRLHFDVYLTYMHVG